MRTHPRDALEFLLRGRETDNFTYEIANTDELVPVIAAALIQPESVIAPYLAECLGDAELNRQLAKRLRARDDRPDLPHFARRYGWYITVRAEKPTVVVETGTHDGLGSALILRALDKNAQEGDAGELLSFDINSTSGWLVGPRPSNWTLVIGDSTQTLPVALAGREVDIFIHDSLHTIEHERFEFDTARQHAGPRQILITDNAHMTRVLREIADENGASFHQFDEELPDHSWFSGVSLGIAVFTDGGQV